MNWAQEELFRRSGRQSRNVYVSGRRTSMRLEAGLWEALEEIGRRENQTIHELCSQVDGVRGDLSLTAAVRAAVVDYFWRGLAMRERPGATKVG